MRGQGSSCAGHVEDGMGTARRVESGPFEGWSNWPNDGFETGLGPFYFRQDPERGVVCAFTAEPRHMNGGGMMHGGCLMAFADFAAFAIADHLMDGPAVTVSMTSDFLGPAMPGAKMEATGEVTRAGGRLVFVRGLITADGAPALGFSAVISRVGSKPG
jgi:uncharacterized protein (TIGR00369 family)